MMLNFSDSAIRQYIQKPTLILLVLAVVFGSVVFGLFQYQSSLEQSNQVTEQQLRNLLKQVRFLRTQERLYQMYGEKYQSFLNEGLVHQQDRVKWTDELLKIKSQLSLSPFNFQFDAEQKLTRRDVKHLKLDKDIFYYTKLHLTIGLMSDLDLVTVLDKIRKNITPLFLVKGCQIQAHNEALKNPRFTPNHSLFDATCTLILFQAKPTPFKLD